MSDATLQGVLPHRSVIDGAGARLLCFSFAGGSAATYREWNGLLAPSIEVCAVELPGRGRRWQEAPLADMEELVDHLASTLAPLFDRPVIMFGHSLGAWIAYALALRGPRTAGLIVSASPGAGSRTDRHRSDLSRLALVHELRAMGGTPQLVLEDDLLLDVYLPAIRADFRLLERWVAPSRVKLGCPITMIAARDDRVVGFEQATAWAERTTGEARIVELGGGHFYLEARRDDVLAVVRDAIRRWC
jgi:surfactin synthase thioesterase subunit